MNAENNKPTDAQIQQWLDLHTPDAEFPADHPDIIAYRALYTALKTDRIPPLPPGFTKEVVAAAQTAPSYSRFRTLIGATAMALLISLAGCAVIFIVDRQLVIRLFSSLFSILPILIPVVVCFFLIQYLDEKLVRGKLGRY